MRVHDTKVIDFEEDCDEDEIPVSVEVGVAIGDPGKFYVAQGNDYIYLTEEQWRFVIGVLNGVIDTSSPKPLPNPTKTYSSLKKITPKRVESAENF